MWNYVYPSYELYHHGIAGMKWGKKNGPPYPLAASAHSASEKKAGWRKSLSGAAKTGARALKRAATSNTTKKALSFANKAAIRAHIKPKFLMSDEELEYSIERLKKEHTYKRAMKGKFSDITQIREQQGKSAFKQAMSAIGKDVALPLITGGMNYAIARKLAGENKGDIDLLKTVMGKGVTMKGEGKKGNRNKNDGNDGNQQNQPKPKKPKEQNNEKEEDKDKRKNRTKNRINRSAWKDWEKNFASYQGYNF